MAVFFSSSSPLIGWTNFCSRLRFIAGMATTSDSIIPPLAAVSGRLPPDRREALKAGMGVLHIVGGQTDVRQPLRRGGGCRVKPVVSFRAIRSCTSGKVAVKVVRSACFIIRLFALR